MKQIIRLFVKRPDKLKAGHFRELFRNTIECDDAFDVDFKTLYLALKILYPQPDVIIEFHLMS